MCAGVTQSRLLVGGGSTPCRAFACGMLAPLMLLFFPTLGLAENPPQPPNAEAPQRTGRFITVDQPINDAIDLRIETQTEQALAQARDKNLWPVIVFEIQPGKSDYLRAMGLANFITGPKFQGATTVAFLPETVTGHALLVALACDQIVLGKNATLGNAGQAFYALCDRRY